MKFSVTPVKPHIGSIVEVDRHALLDDDVVSACKTLLEERGVLVFPRMNLSDEEQLAFTDKWGERINLMGSEDKQDSIYKISLDPKQALHVEYVQATFFWHMDGLTAGYTPPKATLITARAVAAKGGQTEFANTYAAYEALSDEDKADIESLRVVHSMRASMFDVFENLDAEALWQQMPEQEHPLVWHHLSGRRSLVLAATADHIVGMPRANGRALLARLLQWTVQPDFHYRHEWQEGDLVVWDNCGTLHRVIPYDETSGRLMHRTTIHGVESLR